MKYRWNTIVVVISSIVTVSACGGGDADDAAATSPSDESGVVVRALEGIRWENDAYSAPAGEVRIVLENTSSIPHNLAIVDAASTQLPTTLETPSRSDTDEATVSLQPGVYSLICIIPGHSNMNSTLTVD